MFEFKRNLPVAASPCMRCGSDRTVVGIMLGEGESRFFPRGLRWWKFSGGVPLMTEGLSACLDCGCLVGGVDATELRSTIARAGGDQLQAVLGRAPRTRAP